jgi:hypothetical protein
VGGADIGGPLIIKDSGGLSVMVGVLGGPAKLRGSNGEVDFVRTSENLGFIKQFRP